jgi:hypothetical protein
MMHGSLEWDASFGDGREDPALWSSRHPTGDFGPLNYISVNSLDMQSQALLLSGKSPDRERHRPSMAEDGRDSWETVRAR